MSRSMVQPWGPPSALLWLTSSWKTLKWKPSPLPRTLPKCGRGTWMTLVSSWIVQTKKEFFNHINSIDPRIQFTSEDSKPDGSIPFLDSLVMPQPYGSIKTTVFRKPTHTDMYLHWDSYHHLFAKYSVINTPETQRKNCMFHQTVINRRRRPSVQCLKKMQVPLMGLEQG